jgi:hypothetical protein
MRKDINKLNHSLLKQEKQLKRLVCTRMLAISTRHCKWQASISLKHVIKFSSIKLKATLKKDSMGKQSQHTSTQENQSWQ